MLFELGTYIRTILFYHIQATWNTIVSIVNPSYFLNLFCN